MRISGIKVKVINVDASLFLYRTPLSEVAEVFPKDEAKFGRTDKIS
jgi:hypothetical protein